MRVRRAAAMIGVLTMVVASIPLSAPVPTVRAVDLSLGKLLGFDEDLQSTITVGPNAAVSVWLGQIDFMCDTFYPIADIYVMAGVPSAGGALTDASGKPNVVIGSWGGGFTETIAFTAPSGKLEAGTYSVIYDECQNGKYDAGVDAVFVGAITVFMPPGQIPLIDPAIEAIKGNAGTSAVRARAMLDAYALYIEVTEAYALLQCLAGGLVSCAISQATDALKDYLIGQLRTAFGLVDVKEATLDLAEDVTRMYEGLAADPPDPNFQQVTLLGPLETVQPSDTGAFEQASAVLANAMAVDAVLAEGLLHAIERYQGADAADDAAWARQHLTEARTFAGLLANHQTETNAAIAAVRTLIAAEGRNIDGAAEELEQNRSRVALSGFSPDELGFFASSGMTAGQIDDLAALYAELPSGAGFTRADTVARFDATIASNTTWAASLNALVGQLGSIEAVLAVNVSAGGRPIPDAGGPYASAIGVPFSVNSGGSTDPSGSIASSAWDTDLDGVFDDAVGTAPSVSIGEPYDGLVGVRVVDDVGNPAVDYARVTVTDANRAPTITVVTPPVATTTVALGGAKTFTVTTADLDGDTVTGEWFVDGVSTATGNSFGFVGGASAGTNTVRFVADDGHGHQRAVSWIVNVQAPDVDLDGWRANVDCADNDATINPGMPEIQGNAVDENCDGVAEPERNDPPQARNSLVGTAEDTPVGITLIAPDPEGDTVAFVVTTAPEHGALSGTAPDLTYTPTLDYVGPDSFAFTAADAEFVTAPAIVTINVSAINDTPTAFDVTVSGDEDTTIPFALAGIDAEGSVLTFAFVGVTPAGVTGTAPNLTFAPAVNFNGTVTFQYTASDDDTPTLTSPPATVTIQVNTINDPPTAAAASASTAEDTAVAIVPTVGDVDGDAPALVIVDPPQHGTVAVSGAPPFFTYTPSPEYSGPDSFVYRASDANAVSPNATVSITVTPVNDPPVSTNTTVSLAEDGSTWIVLPASDPDSPLIFTVLSQPTNGTLQNQIGRRVLYQPDAEYHGPDSFTFRVTDGTTTVGPFTASITVRELNDPPTAIDDRAVTTADQSITVDVLANDSDIEGAALSLVAIGAPDAGNASLGGGGNVVVSPPLGFTGAINVPYVVFDAGGAASIGTLTVVALPGAAVTTTFTEVGQFDDGDSFNVEQAGPNDLQVVSKAQAFNRIWVAVSTKGTIVKIDTDTGVILGEYSTSPAGQPKDPSRTTVDRNGSVWATNRAGNSVFRVGLVENGQCIDRNGNGVIDTSTAQNDIRAWTNADGADTNGGVTTAADECILNYVRVSSSGTRHVSVTKDNDIWVSGTGNRIFNLIDGETGAIVRTEGAVGYGGYGGLIDPNGVIWSASYPTKLLRWDTSKPLTGADGAGNWESMPRGASNNSYGTCIDLFGNVWVTELGSNVLKYAPDGALLGTFPHGAGVAQGCAVDRNGDVWVAHSLLGPVTVGHLTNEGVHVGNVTVGSGPTGVSVDAAGKVWATNYNSGTVSRIDPTLGPIHAPTGKTVGLVDLTTVNLGGNPYNYSDMTGSTLQGLPTSGTWSAVYDSGAAGATWGAIDWHATVPGGAELEVRVAVGDVAGTLGVGGVVTDGGAIAGSGQFAKVTVTFKRSGTGASPILHDVSLWTTPPAAPVLAENEVSEVTDEDVAVTVDLTSVVPGGAPPGTIVVPVAPPTHGTLTRLDSARFSYTPGPDYNGTDLMLYRVDDGDRLSDVGGAQLLVRPVNDAPVATPTSVTTSEDTPVTFLLGGTDLEGDPLSVIITQQPAHGTLTPPNDPSGPASFVYTPNANFAGADSLAFKVSDNPRIPTRVEAVNGASGSLDSPVVTVPIEVTPINDAPTATPTSIITDEDVPVTFLLTGTDPDGDALTVTVTKQPLHGSLTANGGADAPASFTYTPAADFAGTDELTFKVRDTPGAGIAADSAEVTVTIVVRPIDEIGSEAPPPPPPPLPLPPPLPDPSSLLPATGNDPLQALRTAATILLMGIALVLTARVRATRLRTRR